MDRNKGLPRSDLVLWVWLPDSVAWILMQSASMNFLLGWADASACQKRDWQNDYLEE